jgi:hypothetical protein
MMRERPIAAASMFHPVSLKGMGSREAPVLSTSPWTACFRGRSRSRKSQISPVYARTVLPVPSVRMQIDALHWRAQIKEYVEHDDA